MHIISRLLLFCFPERLEERPKLQHMGKLGNTWQSSIANFFKGLTAAFTIMPGPLCHQVVEGDPLVSLIKKATWKAAIWPLFLHLP